MTRDLGGFAITLGTSLALSVIVKATVVLAGAMMAVRLARRRSASIRHLLLATAFAWLLLLPLVSAAVPPREVRLSIPPPAAEIGLPAPTSRTARETVSEPGEPTPSAARMLPSTSTLSLCLWLAGVASCLVPMAAGLRRARWLRRRGIPWSDGKAIVATLAPGLTARRRVGVLLDEGAEGPMTCGVLRPVILLPRDAATWPPDDQRRALVHELEHIRRGDWLMLCTARVVCALYWFHPLVWMAWRRLQLEAEMACDDAVVRGAPAEAYADQLVAVAERLTSNRAKPVPAMAGRGDLSARVSAVLDDRRPRARAGARWILMVGSIAMLLLATLAPLRAAAIPVASAQAASALPAFDVASVRPNTTGEGATIVMLQRGGRVFAENVTADRLIRTAYALFDDHPLTGAPTWLDQARFSIEARTAGAASVDQVRQMLRRMLAERFGLIGHTETRQLAVYELRLLRDDGRLGPALHRSGADCAPIKMPSNMLAPPAPPPPLPAEGTIAVLPPQRSERACPSSFFPGWFSGRSLTMAQLAQVATQLLQRPVIDRTGLDGAFDVDFGYTPGNDGSVGLAAGVAAGAVGAHDAAPDVIDRGRSLFTALREELGLALQSTRGPVDIFVIDRIERPTAN
jgi:uncharacterized protein (TIGR03435 family)